MRSRLPRLLTLSLLFAISIFMGCASSFQPRSLEEINFQERSQTQADGSIRITAAVLSADETKAIFGFGLYKKGIQPIWLEIENKDDSPAWFLPFSVDPDYFPPLEVTYPYHRTFDSEYNDQIDRYFLDHAMGMRLAPGSVRSGFVFTNLDLGTKSFNVDLVGEDNQPHTFTFFIPVPGLRLDHYKVDWETLYTEDELQDVDVPGLIDGLEALPCCVQDKKGKSYGDPLNIAIVGDLQDAYYAFMRAGWDETETIYGTSLLKTLKSAISGSQYRYSPVSALYVYGRSQDVSLQKARSSINKRNHLRLWLTPMRFEGKPVWIGQISRDIGVRFTWKTITTHKIDPDVDEAREYLLEDLAYAQSIAAFGYVRGVGAAPFNAPRGNLTGDPYFTDGLRLVLFVSAEAADISEIRFMNFGEHPTLFDPE